MARRSRAARRALLPCADAAVATLLAAAPAMADPQGARPRLVGYVPPSDSATGCPAGVSVRVYARAANGNSGGWGGNWGPSVTGSVTVSSPYPVSISQVDVALYPTTASAPLRSGCSGLDGTVTTGGSCAFGVAIPPSSYGPYGNNSPYGGARTWQGAAARVWLSSGGACDSPAAYVQGTDVWVEAGSNLGGSIGQLAGGAIGGGELGALGGLIGSAIGAGIGREITNGGGGNNGGGGGGGGYYGAGNGGGGFGYGNGGGLGYGGGGGGAGSLGGAIAGDVVGRILGRRMMF